MDDCKPSNLREALGVTPLLHLMPLQETAALIAPVSVSSSFQSHTNSLSQQLKDTINENSEDFTDIIESLTYELKNYEPEEFESLKFYKPTTTTPKLEGSLSQPSLTPLEEIIVANTSPVGNEEIETRVFHSQAINYDGSRLSIRKKYESINDNHNEKYKKKFLKEYNSGNQTSSIKRIFEGQEVLVPKIAKLSETPVLSEFERAYNKLLNIVQLIGLNSDENTDNKLYWVCLENKRFVSMQIMEDFFDCLSKLVFDPKVNQINLEMIMRIQGLMLKCLAEAKTLNYSTFIDVLTKDGASYEEISQQYQSLFNFTIATKVMLVILSGNISEKKIYLDDYLVSVIDFVYSLQNDLLIKLTAKVFASEISQRFKPMITRLIEDVRYIFFLLSTYASKYTFDESAQTRLEYVSIQTIEAEVNGKESTSLVNIEVFSNMKMSASDLLLEIFKTQSNQHPYILHELVVGMDKQSSSRSIIRQFKTSHGNKVLIIAMLFVRMVESVCTKAVTEVTQTGDSQDFSTLLDQQARAILMTTDFVNDITTSIVSRFTENPEFKSHLDILVEDLLVLMPYPEWSGAEFLLAGFMKSFLLMTQASSCKHLEPYVFDLLGKMSESLIDLKQISKLFSVTNASEALEYHQNALSLLSDLQSQVNRNPRCSPSIIFLSVKLLSDLNKIKEETKIVSNDLDALNSTTEEGLAETEIQSILLQTYQFISNGIKNGFQNTLENFNSNYTGLILRGELPTLYENFLNIALLSLESSKIKSKSKAIRILSGLIDKDMEILFSQKIQDSIASKLLDKSPLVRDAVIDLIGKFVSSKPELSKNFYKPICECLNDSSTQVKRRVIKLAKVMYSNLDSRKAKVHIATKLILALYDEEDSIVEMVRSLLKQLFLEENMSINNVEVLMDVVSLGGKIIKQFEEYLRVVVLPNQNDSSLNQIITIALEYINEHQNKTEIEKGLKLISTIVNCNSKLITQEQLISLQPFLMEEKSHGNTIYYNLIILRRVLPAAGALRPDYAQSVQNFLILNLTKFNTREMNEAMPCIWRLCELKGNTGKLANASISCMKMIKPFLDKKQNLKPDAKLEKLIHLLGCFGTYCNLEDHRELFMKASLGFKSKESVISGIMKYLLFFCVGETKVRNTAISNVMNVCISHPKFFLSEPILKIIDSEFEILDPLVIYTIITGIIKFLAMDEELSMRKSESRNLNSSLDLAIFHGNSKSSMNDSICAGLVQRYIENILDLSVHDKGSLTVPCIEFLQLVVRLGFANPRVCIPTIIAFESSQNPRIKRIAISLHKELYDKHESLTDTSYIEGVRVGMQYIKSTQSSLLGNNDFFQNIYEIVNSTYSSRKKFVNSLAKILRVDEDIQRDEVIFISNNVANMQFLTLEESLIIIVKIDQVLEEEGVEFYEVVNEVDSKTLKQSSEIEDQVKKSQMFLSLLQLRQILITNYGIDSNQIDNFRPGKVDNELKQPVKIPNDRRRFVIDVDNENGIEYIIQFLQEMQEYV